MNFQAFFAHLCCDYISLFRVFVYFCSFLHSSLATYQTMKKGVLPPFYIASVLLQPHCDSICILILTWTLLAHISVTLCDLGQPSISDILDIIIYHCIHCISYFICISEALVGWV